MRFLAEHELFFMLLTIALVGVLAVSVLKVTLRGQRSRYQAQHRSPRRAWERGHVPRHAVPEHHARHIAVAPAASAYLGRTPDGQLALVDDEHTHELIGAAA